MINLWRICKIEVFGLGVANDDGFPGASTVKNPPAMQETWVQSLGPEDPLERKWQLPPVSLEIPQRNPAGYSPWGHKSRTWLSDSTTASDEEVTRKKRMNLTRFVYMDFSASNSPYLVIRMSSFLLVQGGYLSFDSFFLLLSGRKRKVKSVFLTPAGF